MRKVERVLLIDDDPINNFVNEGLLSRMEIAKNVIVLNNGDKAIEFIENDCMSGRKICSSIILLDHNMPVMNGLEFLTALNKLNITNRDEVYILLLAVQTSHKDLEKYQELGIDDFTSKPLSEIDLLDTLNKYWAKVDRVQKNEKQH